jgi:hypothetical protein
MTEKSKTSSQREKQTYGGEAKVVDEKEGQTVGYDDEDGTKRSAISSNDKVTM